MQNLNTLPYPAIGKSFRPFLLTEPLLLPTGRIIPKGITVRLRQTPNFGWCILPASCEAPRIYRY